jgi:hypothetical protein
VRHAKADKVAAVAVARADMVAEGEAGEKVEDREVPADLVGGHGASANIFAKRRFASSVSRRWT